MNLNQKTKNKHKYAITGGIGSGKSYVCQNIEKAGYPIFYCDIEARHIIAHDAQVQQALKKLVAKDVYDEEGNLNKAVLRDFLCKGKEHAAQIDAIVHPRVGEAFEAWSKKQENEKVFMECAILFESGFERYVDTVIMVTAPLETRIERVTQRDNISREKVLGMMALQLPEEEKKQRADFIINNDGMIDVAPQISRIIED